ncbi:hypothetical protein GCM10027321_25220 [Massilia terrae]
MRQRGAISLLWVIVLSALLALAAMAALFSMRYERNLFAEAWHKVAGGDAARHALDAAAWATGATADPVLRKCLIGGKQVVSNVDCAADNTTTKTIEIHDSHGFAPLAPPPAPRKEEPTSNPAIDKMIEKQLR